MQRGLWGAWPGAGLGSGWGPGLQVERQGHSEDRGQCPPRVSGHPDPCSAPGQGRHPVPLPRGGTEAWKEGAGVSEEEQRQSLGRGRGCRPARRMDGAGEPGRLSCTGWRPGIGLSFSLTPQGPGQTQDGQIPQPSTTLCPPGCLLFEGSCLCTPRRSWHFLQVERLQFSLSSCKYLFLN